MYMRKNDSEKPHKEPNRYHHRHLYYNRDRVSLDKIGHGNRVSK